MRHPSPVSGSVWQHIPLDERDGLVELRNHPSGKQSCHACTKDNGSVTERAHPTLLRCEMFADCLVVMAVFVPRPARSTVVSRGRLPITAVAVDETSMRRCRVATTPFGSARVTMAG